MASESDPLSARDLLAAVTCSTVSALPVFLVAALAVQIGASMHFGPTHLGAVVSLYFLSAAVASIPLSRLVEAVGSLRIMRMGCLVMGLLLLVLAGAVRSLPGLAAVMIGAGMVSAGIQPATNLFLMRRIPRRHRGLAFGIKQAAVPMAVAIGGLSVPAIALTAGWRWAFVAASVFSVVTGLILPRSRTSFADFRRRPPVPRLGAPGRSRLIMLACGFCLGVAAASALSTFTVTAAVAAGEGEATAGLLAGLGGAVAAVTRICVGIRADRGSHTSLVVVISMLVVGALAYVMLGVSTYAAPVLLIPAVVLAFSAGWGWNGLFNLAIASRYPVQAARATGITAVGGRTGGVIGPVLFGLVITHSSYSLAWLLTAVTALAAAMVMFHGRRETDGLTADI